MQKLCKFCISIVVFLFVAFIFLSFFQQICCIVILSLTFLQLQFQRQGLGFVLSVKHSHLYFFEVYLTLHFSRVETEIIDAEISEFLRSKGHFSVKYIGDSLFLRDTFEICFNNIRPAPALLQELGFTIHPEKSVLVPTQQTYS